MREAAQSELLAAEPAAGAVGEAPSAACTVQGVLPAAAAAVWPHVADMIEASRQAVPEAVRAREWPEDILEKVQGGQYQLWLIYDETTLVAVAVTSVERYSRLTACVVQYMAGRSVDEWLADWTEQIRDWAEANGCEQIEARGRWGWGKKLAPLGAVTAGAAYVMEL